MVSLLAPRYESLSESIEVAGKTGGTVMAPKPDPNAPTSLQEQVRLREQQFQATFEQAAVGIAHVAPEGHFLQVNQKLCDIVGYSRPDLLVRTFQDITFPDDLGRDLAYVQQLLQGERQTYTMEKRSIRADGSLVWIQLTVSLVRDEEKTPLYFISVIEDIDERKRLEEDLARERRAFQMITDNAPDVIVRFDRSFRHLYVNQTITAATGKTPQEIIGKTNEELDMPEEALSLWNTALSQVLTTREHAMLEFSFLTPAGLRFYHARLVPEPDAQGEVVSILAIVHDVTELKQTQEALRQSEARARRLIESNIIGVVLADMDGIFDANDAFLDLVGYTHEDLAARRIHWQAMTPPEYLPRDEFSLQELRERGVCTPFEKEYRRRDGSHVAILIGAATVQKDPLQWVSFMLDMTERKRQEQQLQQALEALLTVTEVLGTPPQSTGSSEQDRSSYQELAPEILALVCRVLSYAGAVLLKLLPDSELIDLLTMAGFDRSTEQPLLERMRGQSLSSHFEDEAMMVQLRQGKVLILDVSQPRYAKWQLRADLHTCVLVPLQLREALVGLLILYPGENQATSTPEDQALPTAIARLAALLIERERLREEREEARTRALAAQETNQQMDAFMGIVSHELKTPLTSIKGNMQLVERLLHRYRQGAASSPDAGMALLEKIEAFVERTQRQIAIQQRLINDLLEASSIHATQLALQVEPCDLVPLVQEVVEDQRLLVPHRQINLQILTPALLVLTDRQRIAQVLSNYLTNALKYSEESSPVTVSLDREKAMAYVAVQDHGPGLTPVQQKRIWQRFYRAPEIEVKNGSGTSLGLGLYICRTLIERQGGEVGVESTPGKGSTFWLMLPLATSI